MFQSKLFVFDGNSGFSVPVYKLKQLVKKHGGDTTFSISKETDFLVVPDSDQHPRSSLKQRSAVKLSVPVVPESWIHRSIGLGSPAPLLLNEGQSGDILGSSASQTAAGGRLHNDEFYNDRSTVKVFVSSPFLGMEEYRKVVHKVERSMLSFGLQHQVQFLFIDLNWGVNTDDVAVALDVCLSHVTSSDVFVLLLDKRVGSTPDADARQRAMQRHPWLGDTSEHLSVTALELEASIRVSGQHRVCFFTSTADNSKQPSNSLIELKAAATQHATVPVTTLDLDHFHDDLVAKLKTIVVNQLGNQQQQQQQGGGEPEDPFESLYRYQQEFARLRRRVFVEPTDTEFQQLSAFVDNESPQSPENLLWIYGQSGLGKSAMLANWGGLRRRDRRDLVHVHHCAVTRDVSALIGMFCVHVNERASSPSAATLAAEEYTSQSLLLAIQVSSSLFRRVILIVDGIDQLNIPAAEGENSLYWLSSTRLPYNFRLVVSSSTDPTKKSATVDHLRPVLLHLPLLAPEKRVEMAELYLKRVGKRAPDSLKQTLAQNEKFALPLFLRLLLDQLVASASFETFEVELKRLVDRCKTVDDIFGVILDNAEQEEAAQTGPTSSSLLQTVLCCLWASQHGLSSSEITGLGGDHALDLLSRFRHHVEFHGNRFALDRHMKKALAVRFSLHQPKQRARWDRRLASLFPVNQSAYSWRQRLFHLCHCALNEGGGAADTASAAATILDHFCDVKALAASFDSNDRDARALVQRAWTLVDRGHGLGGKGSDLQDAAVNRVESELHRIEQAKTVNYTADTTISAYTKAVAQLIETVAVGCISSRWKQSRIVRAIRMYEKLIDTDQMLYGRVSDAVAGHCASVARLCLQLQLEPREAGEQAAFYALGRDHAQRHLTILQSLCVGANPLARAHQLLARVLGQRTANLAKVIELYQQASDLATERPFKLSLDMELAERCVDAGRLDLAAQALDRAKQVVGRHNLKADRLLFLQALLAKKKNHYQESIDCLMQIDTKDADALVLQGDVFRKLGHWQQALDAYESAVARDKDAVALVCWRGTALVKKKLGRYQEAGALLEKCLARAKAGGGGGGAAVSLLTDLGDVARKQQKHDESKKKYEQAIVLGMNELGAAHPDVTDAHVGLALLYKDIANYKAASSELKKALDAVDGSSKKSLILVHRGDLERKAGDNKKAVQTYTRALQGIQASLGDDHIEVADTLRGLALSQFDIGMRAAAEQSLKRAVAIGENQLHQDHPKVLGYLIDLASLMAKSGHSSNTVQELLHKVEAAADPSNFQLLLDLSLTKAEFAAKRNLADEAREHAEQAIIFLKDHLHFTDSHPKYIRCLNVLK